MNTWSLLERTFGWGGVVAFHGVGDAPHLPVMHVSPARLRAQLTYLRDHYTVVRLRELAARWRVGATTKGCVAITFDDAYAGVATHALPVLRELDLPATVFVTSNHAAQRASYWWDDLEIERVGVKDGRWTDGPAAVGLAACDTDDVSALERIRSRVLARFAGRWPGGTMAAGDSVWRSLDFDELLSLAADERIDFGVHTVSHPALPFLPYHEQVAEIRQNRTTLRERLPRVLSVVAYPYGLYDETTLRAAKEAGMGAGLTMEGRATADRPSIMSVPRIGAGEMHSPESLARKLNRALRPVIVIRNRGAHPKLPMDPLSPAATGVGAEMRHRSVREI